MTRRGSFRWGVGARLVLVLVVALQMVSCASGSRGSRPKERRVRLVHGEAWLVATSENFEIFSAVTEEETRALLRELELFRAVVFATTNAERRASPIPTRIYAFDSATDYRGLAAAEGSAGLFSPGLRANTVMISDGTTRLSAAATIKHEYVHFVVQNGARNTHPLWYDEGFAEFLSSAAVRDEVVVIGGVPPARVWALRSGEWIPLREIVEATKYEDVDGPRSFMLYPEAWALVHYLTLGREPGRGVMASQLGRFVMLRQRGVGAIEAFEAAFEVEFRELDRTIRKMLRKGEIKLGALPIDGLDFDDSPANVRTASASEAAARLGAVALVRGLTATAGRYFEKAIELDPANARAIAGMGDHHKFSKRYAEAEPFFREAVALAPEDVLVRLDLAEFLDDRAGAAASRADARRDRKEARRLFESILAEAPALPEVHAVLGSSWAQGADEEDGADALARARHHLEEAHRLLPSSVEITYRLADTLLAMDEPRQARALLRSALATRLSKQGSQSVDEIVAGLEASRNARRERWVGLPEVAAPDPDPAATATSEADASPGS